jgi:hypothetical protein
MTDARTRVLQVRFESELDPGRPWSKRQTRLVTVVLYPLEVKRGLVTVDTAEARAVELARQMVQYRLFRPPNLDVLQCSAEVTLFDRVSESTAPPGLSQGKMPLAVENDRRPLSGDRLRRAFYAPWLAECL